MIKVYLVTLFLIKTITASYVFMYLKNYFVITLTKIQVTVLKAQYVI